MEDQPQPLDKVLGASRTLLKILASVSWLSPICLGGVFIAFCRGSSPGVKRQVGQQTAVLEVTGPCSQRPPSRKGIQHAPYLH